MTNSLLLKMVIEIVDLLIEHADFPLLILLASDTQTWCAGRKSMTMGSTGDLMGKSIGKL